MAIAAHGFTHFDRTFKKGDELPDDDPLVALAPHLFEQPEPEPNRKPRNVRIRGPLVESDESAEPQKERP